MQPNVKSLKYFAFAVLISACGVVLAEYAKGWIQPKAKAGE